MSIKMRFETYLKLGTIILSIFLLGCASNSGVSGSNKDKSSFNPILENQSQETTILKEALPLKTITSNSGMTHREWILSNYPQFEEEGIILQLRDNFQYGGLYVYPKLIIINIGDVEVGSALLKQRVEHELTHYFLKMKYNDSDYNNHHELIANGEYLLS